MDQNIAIAADHAGFALKEKVKKQVTRLGYRVIDLGTKSEDPVDYPDFGYKLAEYIETRKAHYGIAICGSGIGICMAANRSPAVRAALCLAPEMAQLARQHNDANVLVLGARYIKSETAHACVEKFLSTTFEEGRHIDRVKKLSQPSIKKTQPDNNVA